MVRSLFSVLSVVSLCCEVAFAKTPAQLKTDLAGIMPSGMKARIVWAQGSNGRQVYGVDSDDGVVKQLSTGSLDADWPCLSRDGSRVFFLDLNSGEIKILNWGTGATSTLQATYVDAAGSEACIETWIDPSNNSEWVIVGEACQGQVGRINVDNPTQCVKLWSNGTSPSPSFGDGMGLSLDGTRLAAMWDLSGNFASGVGNVSNSTVKRHSTWIGCGVSMPADNTYRVSFAAGDGNAAEVRISTGEGSHQVVPVLAKIRTSLGSGSLGSEIDHRWTNNPDYLTVCTYGGGNAGPFLYKVSTNVVTAIQDNLSSPQNHHADVCFFSGTSARPPISSAHRSGAVAGDATQTVYSLDGRGLRASKLRSAANRLVVRGVGDAGAIRLQAQIAQ